MVPIQPPSEQGYTREELACLLGLSLELADRYLQAWGTVTEGVPPPFAALFGHDRHQTVSGTDAPVGLARGGA